MSAMRAACVPSRVALTVAAALSVAGWSATVAAQTLYRSVDAQGRVTFSDKPPSTAARPVEAPPTSEVDTGADGLPFELRQVVQRYPVTLYTQRNCAPCDEGRSMLRARGVPFRERTVDGSRDMEALQQLSGQTGLPLLTIGAQQLRGFADGDWSQYLNAAGYPRSNGLPPGYSPPAARPLAGPAPPPAATAPAPARVEPPATGPTPSNPAGIRF